MADWFTKEQIEARKDLGKKFVIESNRIEGIYGASKEEIEEFHAFMALKTVTVADLIQFVHIYQPDAVFRDNPSVPGVRIGNHIAPPSSPEIRESLQNILDNKAVNGPWQTHILYEMLHPFTDGNGRSGRMLWAWQMGYERLDLGFLHMFYYQTLSNTQGR